MRKSFDFGLLARLALPLVLIPLMGLAARPHAVTQALWQAQRALQDGSPQPAGVAPYALQQAAEKLPWRSDLWEPAGHAALQNQDAQTAIRCLERAAALEALSPQGWIALGDAYQFTGDQAAALRTWQTLRQSQNPPAEVFDRLLQAHLADRDYAAAIQDLYALTVLSPADPALRFQLGLLLAAQQPDAALAHLTQAAELDPALAPRAQALIDGIRTSSLAGDPAYTLVGAGRELALQDEWELAGEAFRQATLARPDFAEAWAFWGEALSRLPLEHPLAAQALPALEKALRLDPAALTANSLLALYWQRQARYDLAQQYLQTAAELQPRNPALQVDLGANLALQGELDAALQAYQKAVELAPTDLVYIRQLAAFSIQYEYRLRQVALPAARQAVLMAPDDPAAQDLMGQVMILLGDSASAERFLLRALELQADYLPARLHLGLVYMLHGEPQRARQEWQAVLSGSSASSLAEQARRLMQNYFP